MYGCISEDIAAGIFALHDTAISARPYIQTLMVSAEPVVETPE